MEQIIGLLMTSSVFIALFIWMTVTSGIKVSISIYAAIFALLLWVFVGLKLLGL